MFVLGGMDCDWGKFWLHFVCDWCPKENKFFRRSLIAHELINTLVEHVGHVLEHLRMHDLVEQCTAKQNEMMNSSES